MKNRGKMLGLVLLGNMLIAFSVCAFVVPNQFMLGGSTGIALTVQYWIPVPLSMITAVTNSALFLVGLIFLGKKFAMTSLCSTMLYPVILSAFERLPLDRLLRGETLAAAVASAVLMGLGLGLVIRAGGSTGGMDIPPCILQKYRGIPVGTSMLVFDMIVLLMQVSYSGIHGIFYSIVIILLTSRTVNGTVAFEGGRKWRWHRVRRTDARIAG